MTPSQSQRLVTLCGQALYGDQWRSPLARALGVQPRSVQRWSDGQRVPRPEIWKSIHDLMKANAAELRDCMLEIETGIVVE